MHTYNILNSKGEIITYMMLTSIIIYNLMNSFIFSLFPRPLSLCICMYLYVMMCSPMYAHV